MVNTTNPDGKSIGSGPSRGLVPVIAGNVAVITFWLIYGGPRIKRLGISLSGHVVYATVAALLTAALVAALVQIRTQRVSRDRAFVLSLDQLNAKLRDFAQHGGSLLSAACGKLLAEKDVRQLLMPDDTSSNWLSNLGGVLLSAPGRSTRLNDQQRVPISTLAKAAGNPTFAHSTVIVTGWQPELTRQGIVVAAEYLFIQEGGERKPVRVSAEIYGALTIVDTPVLTVVILAVTEEENVQPQDGEAAQDPQGT
jgi:hypothetical protein